MVLTRTWAYRATDEELWLYMAHFYGWNRGEGRCEVNGKLYSAFTTAHIVGETGAVVNGVTAQNAAHHILLLLQASHAPAKLQQWRKKAANRTLTDDACGNPTDYWVDVPTGP